MTSGNSVQNTRREFLSRGTLGVGSVALACLLQQDKLLAIPKDVALEPKTYDLTPKVPAVPPRAQAMISLFMHGGPSQMDLMDPKPELTKRDGESYGGKVVYSFFNRATSRLLGSPWKFEQHGESGTPVSELLPHLAGIVDDICVIRSMHTDTNGHGSSLAKLLHGGTRPQRPALGAWLSYGLGSENQNLPAFVVLPDPERHPNKGIRNWGNGWLPSIFQGTVVRPKEPRIVNLDPPPHLKGTLQRQNLDFLQELNRDYVERNPGESDLEARIASYELAARMQTVAKDAFDISRETRATHEMYGLDDPVSQEYGTRCLIARRLIERGVRVVQLFLPFQPWDHHGGIRNNLPGICRKTDKPSAGLVSDLKARGLLDSTLVHWGGEFGRLPVCEGDPNNAGRDHNGKGFSLWLAGGGVRPGTTYGETCDFGHHAMVDKVSHHDFQATLLHLFGLDHDKLTFLYNGREQKLTDDQSCRVVHEIFS